jgi:hypothetical protein
MDVSFQSLILFTIITIAYFMVPSIGKPRLLLNDFQDNQQQFFKKHVFSLGLYLGVILTTQLFLNVGYLMSKCGGAIGQNIGAAALYTFIPWIFIFGCILIVIVAFPGFKTAFSDVVGYYIVASRANDILATILKDTSIQTNDKNLNNAAEAIVKMMGNKSILINQMNPQNFNNVWTTLQPLMKGNENDEIKQELLDLVIIKDNIGEAFWYIYTAILINSIVYYNLATKGCQKSVDQIKADHDAYIKQLNESNQTTTTTYTK